MVEKIAASVPATGAAGPASGADFAKQLAQSASKGGPQAGPPTGLSQGAKGPAGPARPAEGSAEAQAQLRVARPGAKAVQPGARAVPTQAPRPAERGGLRQPAATKAAEATAQAGTLSPSERPGGARILTEVQQAQARLDQILKMAESGRTFSPAELLAFQAHTYRASQELEMAGKVVEKGTSAVKQTLQTQI